MPEKPEKSATYDVSALRKSVAVMDVLVQAKAPLGLSELARLAEIPKNMCFRILETMTDMGWVEKHADLSSYELTHVPFQFFGRYTKRQSLIEQVLPELKRLHEAVEESVYLSVLQEDKALNLFVLEGTKPISVSGHVGGTFDLHATANGKALLAWADKEFQVKILKGKLTKYTEQTIIHAKDLKKELSDICERGYATNQEEYGKGLLGLAAPIFDERGTVVASMGFFAPTTNIPPADLEQLFAFVVTQTAKAASERLGYFSS